MIDYLVGKIQTRNDPYITLLVNGVGYKLQVPDLNAALSQKEVQLHVHYHWNAENGPSLFGFSEELSREVFRLIIEVPKIGPKIAVTILTQMSASAFLEAVTAQDEKALSAINGIGAKKAEQIIMALKGKVSKLISSGKITTQSTDRFAHWQHLSEALTTLGYSKQEVNQAVAYISQNPEKSMPFDKILRSALAFLSKNA